MSIPVKLENLEDAMTQYRFAYLMTSSDQGPPHAVQVAATLQNGALRVDDIGNHTHKNLLARPAVSLLWPPQSAEDYSLIVDGQAAMAGETLQITPTRAVLHRSVSAPTPQVPGSCSSDCVELALVR